jgi:hypothetical protein
MGNELPTIKAHLIHNYLKVRRLTTLRFRIWLRNRYPLAFYSLWGSADGRYRNFSVSLQTERGISWNSVESIFVHIPKTAGTSVRMELAETYGQSLLEVSSFRDVFLWIKSRKESPRAVVLNHVSAQALVDSKTVATENLGNAGVFTVFRSPVERFHSAFEYARRVGYIEQSLTRIELLRVLSRKPWPQSALQKTLGIVFFRPQVDFLAGLEPSTVAVHRFDHLETLRLPDGRLLTKNLNVRTEDRLHSVFSRVEQELFDSVYEPDIARWSALTS